MCSNVWAYVTYKIKGRKSSKNTRVIRVQHKIKENKNFVISVFCKVLATQNSNSAFKSGLDNWHTLHIYVCQLLLTYKWFWICIHRHICLFFPYDFLKFSEFLWFLYFYAASNFLLYSLFVLGIGRFFTVYICFKEPLFFNFSYKLSGKYFSLPQSTFQFWVSLRN